MADAKLTTPVAIIVAGALMGIGAYFGLRARPAPVVSPSPPTALVAGSEATTSRDTRIAPAPLPRPSPPRTDATGAPTVTAVPTEPPAAVPPIGDERAKVIDEVKRTFESLRPALIERCWKPSIKAQAEPKTARITFNFGFAADGTPLSRGVMEDRRSNRSGLGVCVGDAIPMFPVAPPGVSTYVEVPLELP